MSGNQYTTRGTTPTPCTDTPSHMVFRCPLTVEAASGADKQRPQFRMVAYTGGTMRIAGFPHPVVVDLEGLAVERQDIPVRLDHNPRQGVGHTHRVLIEDGQVLAEGLISRDTSWARDVAHAEQMVIIPSEDLAAGGDIADRLAFVHPRAVTLTSIGIMFDGAPAGVDDANTSVILLEDDASNAIVTKTYNTATQPPTSDYEDLGTLDATHKVLTAGEHVLFSITNGATADLASGSLVIRYVPTNA